MVVFVVRMSVAPAQNQEFRRIPAEEYIDKMKAGWIGQMVGVGWGGPTEFRYRGAIIPEEKMPKWKPGMVNQFRQDDIYVEMTFLRTLELYGLDVSMRQAGIDFANSGYMLWHANRSCTNVEQWLMSNGVAFFGHFYPTYDTSLAAYFIPGDCDPPELAANIATLPVADFDWDVSQSALESRGLHLDIRNMLIGWGLPAGDTIYRLREGIERFMITDINNPAGSAMAQSTVPVMWDNWQQSDTGAGEYYGVSAFNHIPGGANALYMDGHVEFVKFGAKYPCGNDDTEPGNLDRLMGTWMAVMSGMTGIWNF
jgi:prepilin-type processing-associated H-X9-DG protein